MKQVNMATVDLNLLKTFLAIWEMRPGGQFNFPYLWARKFPHPVKQDEIVI